MQTLSGSFSQYQVTGQNIHGVGAISKYLMTSFSVIDAQIEMQIIKQ